MAYSNAVFYLDLENGSDSARTALTSVTVANNGAGLVRCTKTAHGLVTGAVVDVTGNYNGAWIVTVIDANTFDLDASTYASATALTVTPRGGSSKADAWKSINSGATSSRIFAGDTIRIMASPDETLVGNATWTDLSKTVTLASAVTTNISDCETAWTASANVTCTADTAQFKEGSKSMKAVIVTAFTTGLVAYFATGTLNLSGYQQVSFWVYNSAAVAASTLSLRLCSDTAGATTVHTIAIPALPSTNQWTAFTVDLGANMNSSIQSVALYADLDPGAQVVQIDNIIACKASSSADALTLTSLIGKVWNRCWTASTAYAANDIRKPTQPNRNGFCYKVTAGGGGNSGSSEPTWPQEVGATVTDGALTWTCFGLEETWHAIQSINGTTVKLDNHTNCLGSAGRGYSGTTETVATYKRECIKLPALSGSTGGGNYTDIMKSGTAAAPIVFSGGWNRTDMTTQTGETWLTGQNGYGVASYAGGNTFLKFYNYNAVRFYQGFGGATNGSWVWYYNCHVNSLTAQVLYLNSSGQVHKGQGLICCNSNSASGQGAVMMNDSCYLNIRAMRMSNHTSGSGVCEFGNAYNSRIDCPDLTAKNNEQYGFNSAAWVPTFLSNLVTGGNTIAALNVRGPTMLTNALMPESTVFATMTAGMDNYIWSHKHQRTPDSHLGTTDGGTIISATDQRHTASGISWKFRPTSTSRNATYPLRLSVAKIACVANTPVNLSIWTRRDSTNISGALKVAGWQIAGVPVDVTVACAPTINTWVQSSTLTFTPTETGVVEVTFEVYDGVGTTNNFWIDDLAVA